MPLRGDGRGLCVTPPPLWLLPHIADTHTARPLEHSALPSGESVAKPFMVSACGSAGQTGFSRADRTRATPPAAPASSASLLSVPEAGRPRSEGRQLHSAEGLLPGSEGTFPQNLALRSLLRGSAAPPLCLGSGRPGPGAAGRVSVLSFYSQVGAPVTGALPDSKQTACSWQQGRCSANHEVSCD